MSQKRPAVESFCGGEPKRGRQLSSEEVARQLSDEEMAKQLSLELNGAPEPSGTFASSRCPEKRSSIENGCLKMRSDLGFCLTRVPGISSSANECSVGLSDLFKAPSSCLSIVACNYMVDLDFLVDVVPLVGIIPTLIVHGEKDARALEMKTVASARGISSTTLRFHAPKLPIAFGTHHTKCFLIYFEGFLRVVIHTANLIPQDWAYKSQAVWWQDFPQKQPTCTTDTEFERDLSSYFTAVGVVDVDELRKYDFSEAHVKLVYSTPGYHTGEQMRANGHMRLRHLLSTVALPSTSHPPPLCVQCSSMGALDEKWFAQDFCRSLTVSQEKPRGEGVVMQIVWPTVEDVRTSKEGYASGGSIPFDAKNYKPFLDQFFCKWSGVAALERSRMMPHMKTFSRLDPESGSVCWSLLTSHNLSKAAWGSLQKDGSQLMVRSYEMGVLFLPNVHPQRPKLVLKPAAERSDELALPFPFELPARGYCSGEDIPWQWNLVLRRPDTHGRTWNDS